MSLIFVFKTILVCKLLASVTFFSISLTFVFTTVLVIKPLASGIIYQHLQFFSLNFDYLCCIYLYDKVVAPGIYFSKSLTFVFPVLNFVFLKTSLFILSLNFFNSTGTVFNLPTSTLMIYFSF